VHVLENYSNYYEYIFGDPEFHILWCKNYVHFKIQDVNFHVMKQYVLPLFTEMEVKRKSLSLSELHVIYQTQTCGLLSLTHVFRLTKI
jgi:hypothetical protein